MTISPRWGLTTTAAVFTFTCTKHSDTLLGTPYFAGSNYDTERYAVNSGEMYCPTGRSQDDYCENYWLLEACVHRKTAAGYCREMPCWNYVNKWDPGRVACERQQQVPRVLPRRKPTTRPTPVPPVPPVHNVVPIKGVRRRYVKGIGYTYDGKNPTQCQCNTSEGACRCGHFEEDKRKEVERRGTQQQDTSERADGTEAGDQGHCGPHTDQDQGEAP